MYEIMIYLICMVKILNKEKLAENISRIVVDVPHIAKAAKPGNFIVIIPTENAERIPLTIADADTENGTISIIFQIVGGTTKLLDSLKVGDTVAHLLGPLGHPSVVEKLRSCEAGELLEPFFLVNIWLILRLDQWDGARLDDEMREELLGDLFEQWLDGRVSELLAGRTPGLLPTHLLEGV